MTEDNRRQGANTFSAHNISDSVNASILPLILEVLCIVKIINL